MSTALIAEAAVNQTVFDGAILLAIPVALLAGLVSFFSPCVLPLVPGYLSYVTGFSAVDLADAKGAKRGRMVLGSALFVLGFSAVFVSGGALFGFFGDTLAHYRHIINIVMGIVTVLMGLAFMGLLPGFSMRELRTHRRPAVGLAGAPLLGIVFGLGWSPCLGPTYSAINTLAMNEANPWRGSVLAVVYCLGLGVPFIVAALAFRRALTAFGWIKQHYQWVMRIGGGMLVAVGLLLLTGAWDDLVGQLRNAFADFSIGI
ncbi:cytochrome c biogenesis CcdA family protein [Kitasatospora sp. McL0602]|uniref:cytochrome c biogenesis CcdA family protein n=1 Tax=Kitasatospora sp. McL0602 TaxID=3439530 RepID=UPI003F88A9AB